MLFQVHQMNRTNSRKLRFDEEDTQHRDRCPEQYPESTVYKYKLDGFRRRNASVGMPPPKRCIWSRCDLALWPFDLKSNRFIFRHNFTKILNLMKFSQAVCRILCLSVYDNARARTDAWTPVKPESGTPRSLRLLRLWGLTRINNWNTGRMTSQCSTLVRTLL